MHDVVIIGAGPAGLSAAIYTARAGLKTVLLGFIEQSNAYKAHIFENYMGFEERLSGPELMQASLRQAQKHGAQFMAREAVDIHNNEDGTFTVMDSVRESYMCRAVIICSGLGFKPSGIKNEQALLGRGVSFCATCDGPFFKGKKIAVIGEADFAGDEALMLLALTKQISILSHGKEFAFSPEMVSALDKAGIKYIKTHKIMEFAGAQKFEGIKFSDGSAQNYDGAFLALGHATAADFANKLGLEHTGPQNAFIVANSRTGETNIKGVYAAGDCTGGNAQAAKSSGEGCNAAISVIKSLKGVAAYVDYS